jgi:transcriptional regulator with XRE-family HTH domain
MSTFDEYKAELDMFLREFGNNVRGLRLTRAEPVSQERLAERTRLHRTEIGKIEQGAVEPRLTTLFILADALGVTIDDLLEGLRAPVERKPSPQGRFKDSSRWS